MLHRQLTVCTLHVPPIHDFLAGLNKYFLVTSKEFIELSYLNLNIIQSTYKISIYETYHIQDTILSQWFTDSYERVNSDPNPFK